MNKPKVFFILEESSLVALGYLCFAFLKCWSGC